MALNAKERVLELDAERRLLKKADVDIEEGWSRVRDQQDRVMSLRTAGLGGLREAEHLLQVMMQTLVEWERHRTLIEQRIAFLEKQSLA